MSDKIVINFAYVLGLKEDVDTASASLREDERELGGTPSDDRIHSRLTHFRRDWDERRDELADSLDSVAAALGAIHDSFLQTDEALVNELHGEA